MPRGLRMLSLVGSLALLSWAWRAAPSSLTRGPYLQNVTAQTATIVCRTDSSGVVTLRYGRQPGPPWAFETSSSSGTTHVFALTGLRPETRYDYELVSGSVELAGGPSCFFRTAPPDKSRAPFSFLAWGDSGTGSSTQLDVAARMEEVLPAPSFALGLGDLVYDSGAAADYDPKLFRPYEDLFPHVPFWPTLGNHDVDTSSGAPYFDAFYLPTNTGATGHPSNTERYYSFDHGMAHFTCLDSELSSSSPGSAMYEWLEDDLADARARGKRWLIVFMHRPVYSDGTHDSSTESSLIELRENLVPVFEAHDVDLAAFGHSHNYERSFLARNDAILQSDSDDYSKISSPDGTIYMVSGCGGKTGGGGLNHPLMSVSYGNTAGFNRIDVRWEELRGTFIRRDGTVGDLFTVHKANDTLAPRILAVEARASDEVAVVFDEPVKDGTGTSGSENLASYVLQPSRSVLGATRQPDERTVVLTTASLQSNRAYQLSVSNVQDLAGNEVEASEGLWFTLPSASAGPPSPVVASEVHTANGPATIAFSSTRSSDDDGALSSVRWDFGDGSPVVQGAAVQHEYDVTGFFNASLIVADAGGLESVAQWPIRIHSQGSAPVANLSAPSSAQPGQNVTFGSSGSSDPDGGPIVIHWDFGDPASASNHSNVASPTHAYATAGTYTVVLTVVDDEGSTATDTSVIAIGGGGSDTTPPQVTSRSPAPNATGVAATADVTATFSEAVQGVSGSTFTLRQGSTSVAASVSYDSGTRTATLDPSSSLTAGATYTASLTSGIRDLAGNALAALSWTFTVGSSGGPSGTFLSAADAFVRSNNTTSNAGSDPALRLRGGDPEYRSFLRFQVSGLAGSVTSATLRLFVTDASDEGGSVYGVSTSWTESGITWSNAPTLSGSPLDSAGAVNAGTWAELDVTAHVTGDGTYAFGLSSSSENSIYFSSREGANPPQLVISTGGPPPDTTPPQVTGRSPAPNATGVSATTNVTATFSESVQGVGGSTFTLRQGSTSVSASVSYDDASRTATLNPSSSLTAGATYTASLASGIRDLAGNALAATSWSFTVATSGSPGGTFLANADAMVRSSSPTGNLGSDPTLRVRAGDPEYQSFVRFQVSGLTGSVTSATLRLFVTDGSDDAGTVYGVGTSWTENGITWDNAPALSGTPLDSAGSVNANAWAEFDVTDAVSGDGTFAFGLDTASENSAYFSSREGANPPQLVIVLGAPSDTTPPQVTSRSPGSGATGVAATTNVTATFNEPVQGVSGSTFTLRQGSTSVAANVSYDSATRTATLDPSSSLIAGATYTASLTSGIRDLAGNALAALSWSFTVATSGSPGGTFVANADAMVRSSSPTGNLGSDPALRLRAGDPEYRSFVRFQVSGLTGSVASATLRLFVTDGSDDAGTVYGVGTSWTESGITWDNAPALSGTPLDSAGSVNANAWAEFDVTDAVSGDGTYAFGLDTTSENSAYFSAREGANAPQLVIALGAPQDTTPPQVSSRSPGSGATGVSATTNVTATFNEPVQGVGGSTFTLRQGSTSVAASVSYDSASRTATLNPSSSLAAGATYTASLTSGIRDLAGNALAALSWSFTVAGASSGVFEATADAYVRSNSSNGNFGSDDFLRLEDQNPDYLSYVRFDVSGLAGTVSSATLRLYVTDPSSDGGDVHGVSTSWNESSITWSNAPSLGSQLDSVGSVSDGSWVEFDVTDHVGGNGSVAFALRSSSNNGVEYSSREGSHPPELVVEMASP